MPYIKEEARVELSTGIAPRSAGELNYLITCFCLDYLNERADTLGRDNSYGDYNEVIGVLEACKLEFYRRAVANYEDKKIQENGDVY